MNNKIKMLVRVAVFAGLLGPLMLREKSGALEPFPAVLQPSGASKLTTKDTTLTFYTTQLIALKTDGSEQRVDAAAFMGNIPRHYWQKIAGSRYGLKLEASQGTSLGPWMLTTAADKPASSTEREEAIDWIHTRLQAQGIERVKALRTRKIKTSWDIESDTEVKREIQGETDVDIQR